MIKKILIFSLFILLALPTDSICGGRRSSSHRASHKTTSTSHYRSSYRQHKSTYSSGTKRDSHGKIKRSSAAKTVFKKQTGYPHGRKGYVIDHKVPLSRGGSDSPSNMQWQTKEAAKSKDKWERK